jgi:hypothetical protein
MVAPARKRVAAAAAIAAPDLEVTFMTFLQKDVGNDLQDAHQIAEISWSSHARKSRFK